MFKWLEAIMHHHQAWPTLVNLIACCLTAFGYCLNQYWITINEIQRNLLESILNKSKSLLELLNCILYWQYCSQSSVNWHQIFAKGYWITLLRLITSLVTWIWVTGKNLVNPNFWMTNRLWADLVHQEWCLDIVDGALNWWTLSCCTSLMATLRDKSMISFTRQGLHRTTLNQTSVQNLHQHHGKTTCKPSTNLI